MRCWPRQSAIRNPSRSTHNPSRSATRNPSRSAKRDPAKRDRRKSARLKSKEFAVNRSDKLHDEPVPPRHKSRMRWICYRSNDANPTHAKAAKVSLDGLCRCVAFAWRCAAPSVLERSPSLLATGRTAFIIKMRQSMRRLYVRANDPRCERWCHQRCRRSSQRCCPNDACTGRIHRSLASLR